MFQYRHVHFIGIGGIGMSALARILISMGVKVSGSDISFNKNVKELSQLGADVWVPHSAARFGGADLVVYSSAISEDNPELKKAKELGIRTIKRGELLALVAREKENILVAGSHGKTTTASMLAKIFMDAGLAPTVIVGGKLPDLDGANAHLGDGQLLIAETDESDGSFLFLEPEFSVVTNVDREHLNHYGSFEELKKAFRIFVEKTKKCCVLFIDDPSLREMVNGSVFTYSLGDYSAQVFAEKLYFYTDKSVAVLKSPWGTYEMAIKLMGIHNIQNAMAAFSVSCLHGLKPEAVLDALYRFSGVERRLTVRGEKGGVVVIDDYAHHPTEIQNTLKAVKQRWRESRVIAVFQPHRYTRVSMLWEGFATAFVDVDQVWVTDIYSAGESPNGFDIMSLVNAIYERSGVEVFFVKNWEDMVFPLSKILSPGDVVITLGAGDIWRLCEALLEKL